MVQARKQLHWLYCLKTCPARLLHSCWCFELSKFILENGSHSLHVLVADILKLGKYFNKMPGWEVEPQSEQKEGWDEQRRLLWCREKEKEGYSDGQGVGVN